MTTVRTASTPPRDAPTTHGARPVLAAGLLLAAVLLWTTGLRPVDPADLNGWGLITALTAPTLLAYPLLAAAAVTELRAPRPRTWMLAAITAAAVLMIYGLQPAVEGVARLPSAWVHAGFTAYIAEHGRILPNFDARFSWPGFFALVAFLCRAAGGVDPTVLLNWTPPVLIALTAPSVWVIARATLGDPRAAWLATWVFLAADWTEQDYFSPQGIAYVLMLAALAVTVHVLVAPGIAQGGRIAWADRSARPAHAASVRIAAQLVVLTMVVALAPTHQLTPYALVGLLAGLLVWRRLWSRWLPVFALVPPVVWFVLGAGQFWSGHLDWLLNPIGSIGSTVSTGITERIAGDTGHTVVTAARVAVTCAVLVAAAAGFLILRHAGHRTWTLPALSVAPFGLAVLQPYGGEIFIRCYLYALPWLAVGAGIALDRLFAERRRPARAGPAAAAVVLVVLMGTTVFTRGGNDAYVGMTAADVRAVRYVYAHAQPVEQVMVLQWYEPMGFARIGAIPQGAVGDPSVASQAVCTDLDTLSCLLRTRPAWVLVNPQQDNAGQILNGRTTGWTWDVVTGLLAHGYRLVFDEQSSLVLSLDAGSS